MRLYSFVNYYLSPIQHGIQTAHCVSDMSRRYKVNTQQAALYNEWADHHKTIIVLNGGNSQMLADTHMKLVAMCTVLELPVVRFNEDEQSLNSALTSVAIILPENLYAVEHLPAEPASAYIHAGGSWVEGRDVEYDLISLVKSHRLA